MRLLIRWVLPFVAASILSVNAQELVIRKGERLVAGMTPREEEDLLLSESIEMAKRLIQQHGSHIPFAMVISSNGERIDIAADDSSLPGADALFELVTKHVAEKAESKQYRAVAVVRNVEYRSAKDGQARDAIEVTLDHQSDTAITCYINYELKSGMVVITEDIVGVSPKATFFSK